jgi:hypothetical protein
MEASKHALHIHIWVTTAWLLCKSEKNNSDLTEKSRQKMHAGPKPNLTPRRRIQSNMLGVLTKLPAYGMCGNCVGTFLFEVRHLTRLFSWGGLALMKVLNNFIHNFKVLTSMLHDTHCTKNSKHKFPEMKLHGLVPYFYIHVPSHDIYIPMIGPRRTDRSWEYINRSQIHECGNWETEHYNSVLEIRRPHSFISGNT